MECKKKRKENVMKSKVTRCFLHSHVNNVNFVSGKKSRFTSLTFVLINYDDN